MQNKNGQKICQIAFERIALLKVHKNPGQNPSGIRDLRQCSNIEVQNRVQKELKFESLKSDAYMEWHTRHGLRVRAIFIFFTNQIKAVIGPFFGPRNLGIA